MDRCELAIDYHRRGFNCAQSVLAAFGDQTHLPEQEALAVSGGLGGGVGGSHAELCGAASGAVLTLGLLYPHTQENSPEAKRRVYNVSREFLSRFQERFGGLCRCGELLAARIQPDGKTPAAQRMGLTDHCSILIVTAVEITEELLRENGIGA